MDHEVGSARPLDALVEGFERAGWEVSHPVEGPDLLCQYDSSRLAVALRSLRGRIPFAILRASLADALLVARARAERLDASPLAVVAADALSDRAIADLELYMRDVAPDRAWGVIDARGRWHFVGEGLAGLAPPPRDLARGDALDRARGVRPDAAPQNPFSDLGQWMLKVLLAPSMPRLHLPGAEPALPIRGVIDLARRAAVAPSRASVLVAELERRGYVERWRRELRLVRIRDLLEDWRQAANANIHDVPVRFALPAADPTKRLQIALMEHARGAAEPRACLGLFSAAAKHGVSFVRGAPIHVMIDSAASSALRPLGLVHSDHPAQADLYARVPRFRESAFRGASNVDHVPVADLLQCWLDVSAHPARGADQAAEIAALLGLEEFE